MESDILRTTCRRSAQLLPMLLLTAAIAWSQVPPDRDALLSGEGTGQGSFAEIHGYPGPKHVLDLSKELQLTDDQKKAIQTIFEDMQGRAKELGQTIVKIENEFDGAFAQGLVTVKSIQDDTEEIGRLRGKLRAVHLIAHTKTQKVLTSNQLSMYKKLRSETNQPKDQKKKP